MMGLTSFYGLPPAELERRLLLLRIWWGEWKEALVEDQTLRIVRAAWAGIGHLPRNRVGLEAYEVFQAMRHPPGVYPPYSAKKSGRLRKDPPVRRTLLDLAGFRGE